MFPEVNLDIIRQQYKEQNKSRDKQGITYLYDFKKGDFILKDGKLVVAEGEKSVQIWIEKILLTEEFVFNIYQEDRNEEYGTTIRKLVLGRKIPKLLLHSELKRIISEKMKQHVEIERIEDFRIEQKMATLTIYFTVILISGENFGFEQEVAS